MIAGTVFSLGLILVVIGGGELFTGNPGEKLGAVVEGKTGKGRWIYIGLGLWRQLPAGTDGAYQLLANLISLGKTPGVAVGITSPAK